VEIGIFWDYELIIYFEGIYRRKLKALINYLGITDGFCLWAGVFRFSQIV